ncbi:MAG: glycosyltransferase family 2 protein [Bacteroidaceae bacterium]|nr:glycosyltransferase family 2 protein [Bacteroidaceae bacterium]
MDIAICLIAYNRINSLKRLLSSLDNAVYPCPVKLYISVDKSDVDAIQEFSADYHWNYGEKEVISHKKNLGLRKHILECGNLVQKHDALIVLEDDIVVAPGFYLYAQATVRQFVDRTDVAGISLYGFSVNYHSCQPFTPVKENSDVFLMQNAQSWGQVWIKEQWNDFKAWYDKNCEDFGQIPHLPKSICSWSNKSWLKYHTRYCIENDKYFVYPYMSYTTCFSDVGEHVNDSTPIFQTPLSLETDVQPKFCPTVKYDCYFENQKIYEWLGMQEEELCIDYYGDNGNQMKRRYWLSKLLLPYKIIKSFGLQMRPYELNVKYSVAGNDLFLYDTSETKEIYFSEECHKRHYFYLYGTPYLDTAPLEWEIGRQKETIANMKETIANHQHWKKRAIIFGCFMIMILFCVSTVLLCLL